MYKCKQLKKLYMISKRLRYIQCWPEMLTVKLLPICVKNSKQLVFNDKLIMTYGTCILLNYFIKSGPQGDFLTQRHIIKIFKLIL